MYTHRKSIHGSYTSYHWIQTPIMYPYYQQQTTLCARSEYRLYTTAQYHRAMSDNSYL